MTRLAASWGLAWPAGFESGFGFEAVGFRFGFKKIGVDSDSAGFGFEMPGFAHHWKERGRERGKGGKHYKFNSDLFVTL